MHTAISTLATAAASPAGRNVFLSPKVMGIVLSIVGVLVVVRGIKNLAAKNQSMSDVSKDIGVSGIALAEILIGFSIFVIAAGMMGLLQFLIS